MAETVVAKMAVQIAANTAGLKTSLDQASGQLSKFTSGISNTFKGLAAGFGLLEIGKGIINVTGEFQRFQAVLSNTLGSDSEAQKALSDIQRFASQTPFAVAELTGAFVKLANQGFTPTTTELRSLGDLASSTGKSFDQLAEAIIDAQTGEFERLKEFGIRARKSGDQVTFTFKGIQTTVKNTSDAIRGYVLSLGDAEGVSGAMAKISETLEGKISNLGDAWDNLLLTIGQGNKGVLVGAVETLTTLVNRLSHVGEELELDKVTLGFKKFRDLSKETLDYIIDISKTETGKSVSSLLDPFAGQSNQEFFKKLDANREVFKKAFKDEGASVEEASTIWKRYVERRLEAAKADDANDFKATTKAVLDAKAGAEALYNTLVNFPNTYKGITGAIKAYKEMLETTDLSNERSIAGIQRTIDLLEERLKPKPKGLLEQLQKELKTFESLQSRSFDAREINTYALAIDILQEKIKKLTTSFKEPFIISIKTEKVFTDLGLDKIGEQLQLSSEMVRKFQEDYQASMSALKTSTKGVSIEIGGLVSGAISSLAQSLVGVAMGTESLGKALLGAIGKFAVQFGELLIASGVGTLALQSGNPYAMIAGGAILVAAGAALSALSKQRENIGKGGGSSVSSASRYSSSSNARMGSADLNRIYFEGKFKLEGRDLVAVVNSESGRQQRLG